ncbi:tetratricopeptide repeat protein [Novosphingobium sp.]|uniref:tetratricopeptide repeat protein n=1 Tax=Novosphingobium sp. TaxID=1874826 RepID=UPI003B522418
MIALLMMLMQIGPDPHVYKQTPLPLITQQRRDAPVPTTPMPLADPLSECMTRAHADPAAGLAYAHDWLTGAKSADARVRANQCIGLIDNDLADYAGAQTAFADAVAAVPADATTAVPIMAMAGNAAMANGDPALGLTWFDRALAVKGYDAGPARGAIEADRSRALVAQDRMADAGAALAEARRLAPGDAGVFLLSATLARRTKDLKAAQGYIETAASIDARDPAIGLEAGVIAMLSGHEAAARKSWKSVVSAAPDSSEAETARGYLGQLGPETPASLEPASPRPTSGTTP